ncbi:MAG: pentapeptide repeat-containing protein [Acidobacteriia bacterium]|nr:pentapeptide repeat-containing protein [Terriglobia bacterium]
MKNRHRHVRWSGVLCGVFALIALRHASAANPDHVANFRKTHDCVGCDLSNANLAAVQAPNAKLVNANLANANFYGGSLRGADLTGAMLDGANLEMVDLTGAVGAVLGGAKTDARTTCPNGKPGPCN